jgi:hypothetical protein
MRKGPLSRVSKISKRNLNRISALKLSGYEPNDYVISLALDKLEEKGIEYRRVEKVRLDCITKISVESLNRISKFKITGYESNDYIIGLGLDLLEKEK